MKLALSHIISGGQAGADRGALDAAIDLGIPHGGVCPKGRKFEDGTIPDKYTLQELGSSDFLDRAESNVVNSDATLICTFGRLTGPARQTAEIARKHNKVWLHLDLNAEATNYAVKAVGTWLGDHGIKTLNVGGGLESEHAGLQGAVRDLLNRVMTKTK
ncbi:MAG: putative molybdenum carrier protein [Planctomycetes bacterium]|nr:putative molybdenum carrier protein [Planctomycetota bacterium]